MTAAPGDLPCLNPLARPALLGLLYRVLAGDADPAEAPVTLRRIELTRSARTETAKALSELRARIGIAGDRSSEAAREAQRSAVDLTLLAETTPAPGRPGLFTRQTPAQKSAGQQHARQHALAEHYRARAEQLAAERDGIEKALAESEATAAAQAGELAGLIDRWRSQLAAAVLSAVAAGNPAASASILIEARQAVRGEAMVGVLLVLHALLTEEGSPEAARAMLRELQQLFTQATDPLPRTLSCLIELSAGRRVQLTEFGLAPAAAFSAPQFLRLQRLAAILAGFGYDGSDYGGLPHSLAALEHYLADLTPRLEADSGEQASPDFEWDAQDLVQLVLAASLHLQRDSLERMAGLLWDGGGWPEQFHTAPPRGTVSPRLGDLLERFSAPAWPGELQAAWRQALGCHLLLAASVADVDGAPALPAWLLEEWITESGNWPKDDLYWWTLATLREQPALLKNVDGGPGQLFRLQNN